MYWTIGCLLLVVHVVMAFQIFHHWSHTHAYQHTAQRTAQLVGLDWGGGVYLNYLLTALWLADSGWWWISSRSYLSRPRIVEWSLQAFMAFMFINAVIIFGHGYTRWAILAIGLCVLLDFWIRRKLRTNNSVR